MKSVKCIKWIENWSLPRRAKFLQGMLGPLCPPTLTMGQFPLHFQYCIGQAAWTTVDFCSCMCCSDSDNHNIFFFSFFNTRPWLSVQVNIFGYGPNQQGYWDHYYSNNSGESNSFFQKTLVHDAQAELNLLYRLDALGKITIYHGLRWPI